MIAREKRSTEGGRERVGSGSSKIMGSWRNRGKLGKNVKYFTIEKGLKGGSQEKRKAGNVKYRRWEACTPYSLSPFLIGYVVVDTTKRSQESTRRRGKKKGSLELPRIPLPQISAESCCLQYDIL